MICERYEKYARYEKQRQSYVVKKKDDIAEVLCQLLKQQSAPEVEIDCFDGNPLNFQYFMAIFQEVVETRIEDPLGRLV